MLRRVPAPPLPPTLDYETRTDAPDGYGPCPRCGRPRRGRTDGADGVSRAAPNLFNYINCGGCGYTYDPYTGRDDRREVLMGVVTSLIVAAAIVTLFVWLSARAAGAA